LRTRTGYCPTPRIAARRGGTGTRARARGARAHRVRGQHPTYGGRCEEGGAAAPRGAAAPPPLQTFSLTPSLTVSADEPWLVCSTREGEDDGVLARCTAGAGTVLPAPVFSGGPATQGRALPGLGLGVGGRRSPYHTQARLSVVRSRAALEHFVSTYVLLVAARVFLLTTGPRLVALIVFSIPPTLQ